MGKVTDSFIQNLGKEFGNSSLRNDFEGNQSYSNFVNAVTEDEEMDKQPKKNIKKKTENKEATGAASGGQFSAPLFGKIEKKETKEATGASSAGQYSSPAMWAKSTNKKDWRGKSKTQIPGGKFVTVKKKCKTFPYCNQGDVKALKIYENNMVKDVISKISKDHNISETVIKAVIQNELENRKNK
jgi:hypothetical protein